MNDRSPPQRVTYNASLQVLSSSKVGSGGVAEGENQGVIPEWKARGEDLRLLNSLKINSEAAAEGDILNVVPR